MSPILFPILVPFTTAIICILFYRRLAVQRVVSLVGSALLLVATVWLFYVVNSTGPVTAQLGDWPAPFGITWVVDLVSAIMLVMAGLMGTVVSIYALADIDEAREAASFHPLYHILLMGVCGSFTTGDIFNLYVWFEVMLIASFVLLVLGGDRNQLEGAIKYMTLNVLASAIFLAAVGLLYGLTGSLNLAYLHGQLANAPTDLVITVAMLFLVAFGIKAAIFPLFNWLPAAYHTPPTAITAVFAGLLTKVGVYAMMRVFTLLFIQDIVYTHRFVLMWLAGFTMVIGVLGAASQTDFRRILSFHIVSQIGYMIMGLAIYTPLAIAGVILFIVHNILAKTNLFLISGLVNQIKGTFYLKKLGGLYQTRPFLSLLFLISALSLAGIPPLSGFWAKLILVRAGLEAEQYVIVTVSLMVSVLTLFSMTKIWTEAFWKATPEPATPERSLAHPEQLQRTVPIIILCLCVLLIGFSSEWFVQITMRAADQMLDPAFYVDTVLGVTP